MDASPVITNPELKTELQATLNEIRKAAQFLSDMLIIFQRFYGGPHDENPISQPVVNSLFKLCADAFSKQIQMIKRLENHLQLSGEQIDTGLELWEFPDSAKPLT